MSGIQCKICGASVKPYTMELDHLSWCKFYKGSVRTVTVIKITKEGVKRVFDKFITGENA